jgi:PAS domain S-box-containing protein
MWNWGIIVVDIDKAIELSQAISCEIVIDRILEQVIKLILNETCGERVSIILKEQQKFIVRAEGSRWSNSIIKIKSIPLEKQRHISSIVVHNAFKAKEYTISYEEICEIRCKYVVCLPIIFKCKIMGVIYIENKLKNKIFNKCDIEILKIIASQAASAMQNSYILQKSNTLNKNLETRIDEKAKRLKETIEKLQVEIFERESAEKALTKENNFNRAIIKGISEGLCVFHEIDEQPYFNVTVWNESMAEITGYTMEEINKNNWFEIVYSDFKIGMEAMQFLKRVFHGNPIICKEGKIIRKDGTERVLSITVSVIYTEDGLKYAMALIRDITESKKMEKEIRESEEKFKKVFNNANDGIFLKKVSNDGKIKKFIEVNDFACEKFGYSRKQLVDMSIYDIDMDIQTLEKQRIINEYFKKGQVMFESRYMTKSGDIIPVEINAILFELKGQKVSLAIVRDISERKKTEDLNRQIEESKRLLNETVEYEKLRTEFFANISHELRTPLNVMLGIVQLIDIKSNDIIIRGYENGKFNKYNKMMKQNCYRLLRLVNNLIDVTKIDAGYFNLELKNVDIICIIENIVQSVVEYVENKGITLIFDTNIEEKIIACDPDKIERIILNLISNSVKFTNSGGYIIVNIINKEQRLIISVKDSGIGIPKEKKSSIFERFIQVDKSLTRNQEGSGIGLSLVKSLVEMHGGNISVESEYGKGSEFIIELPVKEIVDVEDIPNDNYIQEGNIEKIEIEFSDIYLN